MSTYPNINNEPELLKIKRRDDDVNNLHHQSERHDYENLLKSPKNYNEYYKRNKQIWKKKKVSIIITEILVGSASAISSSTMGLTNPNAGKIISSSTALFTSIAILITNEHISKIKIKCTKLEDWINIITLLLEKTLKTSMVDKKLIGSNGIEKIYTIIALIKDLKSWKIFNSK